MGLPPICCCHRSPAMRRPSACAACRARRRKCNAAADRPVCVHCANRGIPCVWEPPQGGFYEAKARTGQAVDEHQTVKDDWLPYPIQRHLCILYFQFIHDQNHSIFHQPTFLEDLAHDRIPQSILCAIFALSARFSSDPFFAAADPRQRGQRFFEQGERLVRLTDVSLLTVQLCILLGATASAEGKAHEENIFYSVAGRMGQILDLPRRPTSSALEREINIRVWWSLCMIDVWSSTAVKLPRLMPLSQDVPLPMDELSFISLRNDNAKTTIHIEVTHGNGSQILSEMVKLNRILLKINNINQMCVLEDREQSSLICEVEAVESQLQNWLEELPDTLRDTPANLTWFASRGLGRMYIALFLGYYHFGQLLFYQFLHCDIHEPALATHRRYADRCKAHADRLCDTIYRAFDTPGCDVLYAMVAHVLVIASTVQIHTLLTSPDDSAIETAKERLERNFKVLLNLRPYWPMLDRAMSRLRAFHETCQRSMDTSFVLDRWMLRFLEEPGQLMEGKYSEADAEELWSLEALS